MAIAKSKNREIVEMPNEELFKLIMSDSEELDTFQSETPRKPKRSAVLY